MADSDRGAESAKCEALAWSCQAHLAAPIDGLIIVEPPQLTGIITKAHGSAHLFDCPVL